MANKLTIARPYAKAIFELALAQKKLAEWAQFLQVAAWIVQQPTVVHFLTNPRYTNAERANKLEAIYAPIMLKEGENLFKLLAQRQRFLLIPEIAQLFEAYRIDQEKTVNVQVTSAFPLTSTEKEQLMQALQSRLQRQIMLECHVDKQLIGGAIIRAGDWVMDDSVRSKLTELNAVLTY
jgi:F-type H+-transporting ATPase subunit delta